MPQPRRRPVLIPNPRTSSSTGPFLGCDMNDDPNTRHPRKALRVRNMLPRRRLGGPYSTRPGYALANYAARISGGTYGRGFGTFRTSAGVRKSVVFVDDKMFTVSDSGVAAQVALPVPIVIPTPDPSAAPEDFLIHCLEGDGVLIVNPGGGQKLFTWDGAATFTQITAAPAFYGRPVFYYGRLFGIGYTDRRLIFWSEAGNIATGYDSGGFNNAWDVRQTSSEDLTALCATNEALYYWRESAFDRITGVVDEQFATSGTVAGLSASLGTKSPGAVVLAPDGRTIYFVSQYARPMLYRVGASGPEDIAGDAERVIEENVHLSGLEMASAVSWDDGGLFLALLPASEVVDGSIGNALVLERTLLVFEHGGQFLAEFTDLSAAYSPDLSGYSRFNAHVLGMLPDYAGRTRLAHLGGDERMAPDYLPTDCQCWVWQVPGETLPQASLCSFVDRYELNATPESSQPIRVLFEPGFLGTESDAEKHWQIVTAHVRGNESLSQFALRYRTPAANMGVTLAQDVTATTELTERVVRWGVHNLGRWIQPEFQHAGIESVQSGLPVTISRVTAEGALLPHAAGTYAR